jgi:DNA helicase-2/ATP-dependent DNA helicase PcrA
MNLNPEQLDAVETLDGPLLVLAGAGSGKTRVVTYRICRLIDKGVPPHQIVGVTFTNRAAAEMKERVQQLTHARVLISTFHSLGVRILRESIHKLGYAQDFLIYDANDSEKLLTACLQEVGVKEKAQLKVYKNLLSRAKNDLLKPDEVDLVDYPSDIANDFPKIYRLYQKKLQSYNAVDFDDLLVLPVQLFKEHPDVLEHYQDRWRYMLIDEYQDTNAAQYALVRFLMAKEPNLCVVGDPDQSIYSWRGANMNNILTFEEDYPGAKVIRLEQNYRSRSNILDAANALISNNETRYDKHLWSDLGPGEKIKHFSGDDAWAEARFVADRIGLHQRKNDISLNDVVVFYRTNAQSRIFEDLFLQENIPYVIVGGISFYQRREIKDILAFLRVVHSNSDFISFARTLNIPKRGIGDATLEKLHIACSQENMPILEYCQALIQETPLQYPVKLTKKHIEGLTSYLRLITELRQIKENFSLKELVKSTIELSNYLDFLRLDPESYEERRENLDSLVSKAMEWESSHAEPSLRTFLEELSLRSDADEASESTDRVSLMTIHNGKGLEFTLTFLVGMEEELFPHVNSREHWQLLEEERRLCYVGMTRAKEFLYLTDARFRMMWGIPRHQRPSRFLKEIPEQYLEKIRSPARRSSFY